MAKKTDKNLNKIFGFLIIVALVSGVLSFGITYYKQKTKPDRLEQSVADSVQKTSTDFKVYLMEDLLEGVQEIFLESYHGPNDIIELNSHNSDYVIKLLKDLDLEFSMVTDRDDLDYLYAVHIKNKKIKIKVNENQLYVENHQGLSQLFTLDLEQLEGLKTELEAIYMIKYNRHDILQKGQQIQIAAMDEGLEWKLDGEQVKELQKAINLISPVGSELVAGIPTRYPNYLIRIKKDEREYSLQLINEEILSIDSSDSISYYRYDSKLWDLIVQEYKTPDFNEPSELRYLMKSKKVTIDAANKSFDMEDDTFYHVEIPRYLIKANKHVLDDLIPGEILMFTMKFKVNNREREVKIYENQFIYNNQVFYSEKIGEAIKSFLSV